MSDLNFLDTSGNKITITTPADNSLAFNTSNTERLRIEPGGNIDIKSGIIKLGSGSNRRLMYRSGDNDILLESDAGDFYRQNIASSTHEFFLGNNNRFTIHPSGAVTKPNNPSFRANRSEGSNYTSTTLNEILPWNVVEFDRTNVSGYGYDNSTYKYRVAVAGVYWFHCSVYTDTNVDVMFDIVKNNNSSYIQRAELRQSGGDDIGNNTIVHCAGISQCAVGDYIYVNNSGGSAIELIGGGAEGYIDFSGYLIG